MIKWEYKIASIPIKWGEYETDEIKEAREQNYRKWEQETDEYFASSSTLGFDPPELDLGDDVVEFASKETMAMLNKLGDDGWELVSKEDNRFTFKRPKQ